MRKPQSDQETQAQEIGVSKLSPSERETVIVKTGVDDAWTVYSCERRMVEKIRRLAKAYGVQVREQNFGGVEADLPMRALALRGPSRRREMTVEERAAAAGRLALARAAK